MVNAQNAGPNAIVAIPATFTSATATPTMNISAMDQGRKASENPKARRAARVGVAPVASGVTAKMIAPSRSNGSTMINAATAKARGSVTKSENAITAPSTDVLLD